MGDSEKFATTMRRTKNEREGRGGNDMIIGSTGHLRSTSSTYQLAFLSDGIVEVCIPSQQSSS